MPGVLDIARVRALVAPASSRSVSGMRGLAILIVLGLTGAAAAQPGNQPPYPPPPPYAPPAHGYVPVQLSLEEQQLLAKGEISLGAHAGGVALNWLFGFGVGHAVQGRWGERGWIFTLGELGSVAAIVYGVTRICTGCDDRQNDDALTLVFGGLLAYAGFHIWSIADAAIGPARHNDRVRALKLRLGIPVHARVVPYVNRTRDGGGVAGLGFRF